MRSSLGAKHFLVYPRGAYDPRMRSSFVRRLAVILMAMGLTACGSRYYAIEFDNVGTQNVNVVSLQWGDVEAIPDGVDLQLSAIPPEKKINSSIHAMNV